MFIGEGLSGFLPAMIALVQGSGNVKCTSEGPVYTQARFSIGLYFGLLAILMAVSLIVFTCLHMGWPKGINQVLTFEQTSSHNEIVNIDSSIGKFSIHLLDGDMDENMVGWDCT